MDTTTPRNHPAHLESQRQRLEETLAKLRKSLDSWRVYSFEYEAFREELQALPEGASRDAMLAAGLEIEGELVDEREIRSLLGDKIGIRRMRDQVITAVSHRIDYVEGNIKTIQKQVDAMEEQIAKVLIVAEPDVRTEEGFSVMDIQEELDEDGNVMNAWINGKDPNAASRAFDASELIGLKKLVDDVEKAKDNSKLTGMAPSTKLKITELPETVDTKTTPPPPPKASETKDAPAKTPSPKPEQGPARDVGADSDEEDKEEEGGGYVRVIDDPEEPKAEDWIQSVPGETEEETNLRQEMLKYNMQEIGAVVAELNLEDDGDYYGYEDYLSEDFDDDDDDDDKEEEEDQYGRTTRRVVTESYRKQMEELEERLTGKPPRPKQAAAQAAMKTQPNANASGKKGVRFSEILDIAPSSKPAQPPQPVAQRDQIDFAPDENDAIPFLEKLLERQEITNAGPVPLPAASVVEKPKTKVSLFKKEKRPSPLRQVETTQEPAAEPAKEMVKENTVPTSALRDSVMERMPGAPTIPAMPPSLPLKKMSRFMAAKVSEEAVEPKPEAPKAIMTNNIVERSPSSAPSKANPPDEFDPTLHRREVAAQFHKLRSKMIHMQGGFTERDEERAIVPLDEGGNAVKISRFKAAKLKGLGA